MTDTNQLLREYAQRGSESAFQKLVACYLDLVYSVALRRAGADVHLAQDIAQSVFTDLARKARTLPPDVQLGGWLHRHTCFVASTAMRAERRRWARERQEVEMNTLNAVTQNAADDLGPVLDEAIDQLEATDREAILLRFFERRDLREVGVALGISEDAAQKRVSRAVDKLRERMTASGVATTTTALGAALVTSAVSAAPAGLVSTISGAALATAGVSTGIVAGLLKALLSTKVQVALAAALVSVGMVALVLVSRQTAGDASKEMAVNLPGTSSTVSVSNPSLQAGVPIPASTPAHLTNGSVLHLEIVAADSGKPIPSVAVYAVVQQIGGNRFLPWSVRPIAANQLTANRMGCCDVSYPSNAPMLDVALRTDGFANTRLSWRPDLGEVIPTNYLVRMVRAVLISGRVLDPDGNPVAGADVMWGGQPDPAKVRLPQYHEIGFGGLSITGVPSGSDLDLGGICPKTDQNGCWEVNRIAADVLPRCIGYAQHPDYVQSDCVSVGREPVAANELRNGTHVFRLKRAVTAVGRVVDSSGTPIAEAKVTVGNRWNGTRRTGVTRSDGTFVIAGCVPGKQLVTAEAEGYAATTLEADFAWESEPVRIMLQRGKTLLLRVVDRAGRPARGAYAHLKAVVDPRQTTPIQADFMAGADAEGRIVWTNAPDAELSFNIAASRCMSVRGAKFHPDGEEHMVTLRPELTVQGLVKDQSTGELLPLFRLATGWQGGSATDGRFSTHWDNLEWPWSDFANGRYRQVFCEPPISDEQARGYVFRIEADGYAPFVSRTIAADEGDVELDVTMRPISSVLVTLYDPDGQLAGDTDVGLVPHGAHLLLRRTGLSREPDSAVGVVLLRTDVKGEFTLSDEEAIDRVVAVSADGYAEATPTALHVNPVMHLQPWGRLEVTCLAGDAPAAGREYQLDFSGGAFDVVAFGPKPQVTTDAQGRFSVAQMPPGQHLLTRCQRDRFLFFENWSPGDKVAFEIRPAETTSVTLGSENLSVSARLLWPAGIHRQPQWCMIARLQTPMPKPPPEDGTNDSSRAAFLQSAEYLAAAKDRREYAMVWKDTETLFAQDVQPGNYEFEILFGEIVTNQTAAHLSMTIKRCVQATVPVTVPVDASNRVFDAGWIELKPAPPQAP